MGSLITKHISTVSGIIFQRRGENTKRLIIALTVIMISFTLSTSHNLPDCIQPDTGQRFRIWRSIIITSGDYTECNIWVIQCTADTDNIFNEIRAFHDKLNGTYDELTIHLFRNKIDLDNNVELGTKTYIKGE